jgi:hypothetical protein
MHRVVPAGFRLTVQHVVKVGPGMHRAVVHMEGWEEGRHERGFEGTNLVDHQWNGCRIQFNEFNGTQRFLPQRLMHECPLHVDEELRVLRQIDEPDSVLRRTWRDWQREDHGKVAPRGVGHAVDDDLTPVHTANEDAGV